VAATHVERGNISQQVTFEAELRPYQEIELHARISGYLESLKVDAGDMVKEDQLIAMLDVPELTSDLDHAEASERRSRAEVVRAQAAFDEVHQVLQRITATDKAQPNLIAQQDIDAARAKDRAADATLNAAREQVKVSESDVKKLHIMESYAKITAPFAGVITKRYADPGALIQAGTSTGSQPLVRLSQNDRLRAVFPVSVSYVSRITVGAPVSIYVTSLKRSIEGKVARFNRRVDSATRTMEVEVDVPNADLTLIPGVYASAVVSTESHENTLTVPVDALARSKEGESSVYVINGENKLDEQVVKTGIETAERVEILSGVKENDVVMIGSRAQVKPGERVEAKIIQAAPAADGTKTTIRTAEAH
jgi:RND family efflux transporter MFP subunit